MPETLDIPVQPLTADAFTPYGTVISPTEDGTEFGPHDAVLKLSAGTPRFYAMRLPNRGLLITRITRHRHVTQVLASASNTPWLIAVAPPPSDDVSDAKPAIAEIRAFHIPGDTAIMLHQGTWHAGPLFQSFEEKFFNLELSDTNITDHWTCDLSKTYGITLRLLP
jgi:ureidoglycolate hydrolase